MWELGDPPGACDFFRRAAVATREGPFAQAHEFFGPTRDLDTAPVRISEERGNMRESCGGGVFGDVVLRTFFGFSPDIARKMAVCNPSFPRPFTGTLRHLCFRGKKITLKADASGVSTTLE